MFLFRDTNILAFCGVPLGPSDRLVCGLLNRDGTIALVVPGFEADMADALPSGSHLITWREHEDPYSAVAKAAVNIASSGIFHCCRQPSEISFGPVSKQQW